MVILCPILYINVRKVYIILYIVCLLGWKLKYPGTFKWVIKILLENILPSKYNTYYWDIRFYKYLLNTSLKLITLVNKSNKFSLKHWFYPIKLKKKRLKKKNPVQIYFYFISFAKAIKWKHTIISSHITHILLNSFHGFILNSCQ